ncbi:MAG TPA: hypothetical protein PKC80_10595 [Burkholderiaceae bacterium]|nr:hypothetical protein [Burkholderiaceae bacterium]
MAVSGVFIAYTAIKCIALANYDCMIGKWRKDVLVEIFALNNSRQPIDAVLID